jgi:hypothetical protein
MSVGCFASGMRGPMVLLVLTTALAGTLLARAPGDAPAAYAQGRAAVLTLVAADGSLWAPPEGQAPRRLRADVARGATVTELAWHPTRAELLVVRMAWRGSEPTREPYDSLIRLDLATGDEQPLYPDVGPQARIIQPTYAPDGAWAYADVTCCLSHDLVVFAGGDPIRTSASRMIPPALQDLATAAVGPVAPDGRLLMNVDCCMGPPPPDNPNGIYLAPRDLGAAERLTRGAVARPLGLGPGGAWVAALKRPSGASAAPDALALVTLALPGGAERTIVPAGALPLAERGSVASDGTIAVAARPASHLPDRLADSLWAINPDGSPREATGGAFPGFTAFAWAPADVVAALPPAP